MVLSLFYFIPCEVEYLLHTKGLGQATFERFPWKFFLKRIREWPPATPHEVYVLGSKAL